MRAVVPRGPTPYPYPQRRLRGHQRALGRPYGTL